MRLLKFQIFQKFEYTRIWLCSRMDPFLKAWKSCSPMDNTSKSRALAAKLISKRVRQAVSPRWKYAPQPRYFMLRLTSDLHTFTKSPYWTQPVQSIQTKLTILKFFSSHFILLNPLKKYLESSNIRIVSYFICLYVGYYTFPSLDFIP